MSKGPIGFALRLGRSTKADLDARAKKEGISINQYVSLAIAEKLAADKSAEFFAMRRATAADRAAFLRILNRDGGQPPAPGDEVPPDVSAKSAQKVVGAPAVKAPQKSKVAKSPVRRLRHPRTQ